MTTMTHPADTHPTPADLLEEVRRVDAVRVKAEADLLALACAWADAHPDLDQRPVVAGLGPD
ncbi:hypothetical protein, partial [Nocardioides bigeumensis]|uniref:hypothetical protein n=1 Tax=Nocardioides bigeumensis TaxID=433657 RepID=UPI0031D198AB